ncbi:MAG: hypothetical protein ACLU0O_01285 [Collinsella sp.]
MCRCARGRFERRGIARLLAPGSMCMLAWPSFGRAAPRVEIARALLCPGGAVILDEPFTGLDAAARDATTKVVLDLLDGRTLLLAHMTSPTLRPSISRISPRSKY